jgi:hypothetical protein
MKTLKIVGIVLAILVLVFIVGGLVMPKGYQVERSERIAAPAAIVFAQVNDLRNWEKWSPWNAADPTMQISYSETPVGQGGSYSWTGDVAGEGSLTIVRSVSPIRIETKMDFGEMGSAEGHWDFSHAGGVTSVTWGFSGQNPGILGGWFTLMMDGMVGPQFEAGLAGIKEIAESTSLPEPTPEPAQEPSPPEAGEAPEVGVAPEAEASPAGEVPPEEAPASE